MCDSNEWVLVFGGIMSDLRIWSLQKLWSFRIGHGHIKDSTTCVLTMWVEKIYTILKIHLILGVNILKVVIYFENFKK